MKKTKENFEKYLIKTIQKYVKLLGLTIYHIELSESTDDKREGAIFSVDCNYPYHDVIIYHHYLAFKKWYDGEDIERFLVHELCHLLTEPLYVKAINRFLSEQEIEDERERVTDTIAGVVNRLLNIGTNSKG